MILWLSFQGNVGLNIEDLNHQLYLKFTHLQSQPHLPGDNELILTLCTWAEEYLYTEQEGGFQIIETTFF